MSTGKENNLFENYQVVRIFNATDHEEPGSDKSAFYIHPNLGGHIVARLAEGYPSAVGTKLKVGCAMVDHYRVPGSIVVEFTAGLEAMLQNDGRTLLEA